MKYQSHPLKVIRPIEDYQMLCYFKNGEVKLFDFKPLMKKYPQFLALKENNLFEKAYVDLGGLCVTFNNQLDISEETLYQRGIKYDVVIENKKFCKMIFEYCKYLRKQNQITQKQLASMTNIPQSGIARIEAGRNDIQVGTLINYLQPLGYTIEIKKIK